MFNPTVPTPVLPPFVPRRSIIPTPLRPAHVWKKQFRLFMFPFTTTHWGTVRSLAYHAKTTCSALKTVEAVYKAFGTIEECVKGSGSIAIDVHQSCMTVHHIRVSVNYDIIEPPPFDGYTFGKGSPSVPNPLTGGSFNILLALNDDGPLRVFLFYFDHDDGCPPLGGLSITTTKTAAPPPPTHPPLSKG
jgi:hypothetical protein